MREKVVVKLQKLDDEVKVPEYKHADDSGMDVCAYFSNEWVRVQYAGKTLELEKDINVHKLLCIPPQKTLMVPTGIKVEIPDGYEIQVRPRSGLALKRGITVLNSPGTVDAGYRGEIGVILHNSSDYDFYVYNSDRIAQLVLQAVPMIEWEQIREEVAASERGEGGFGSTGVSE